MPTYDLKSFKTKKSITVEKLEYLKNSSLLQSELIKDDNYEVYSYRKIERTCFHFDTKTETVEVILKDGTHMSYELKEPDMMWYAHYIYNYYKEAVYYDSFNGLISALERLNHAEKYINSASKQVINKQESLIHLNGKNFDNVILTESEYRDGLRIKDLPHKAEEKVLLVNRKLWTQNKEHNKRLVYMALQGR